MALTYEEYLSSPWWRARKTAVMNCRGPRCERCSSPYRLQLHHRTYKRLFRERPEDVELLCDRCHRHIHGLAQDPDWPRVPIGLADEIRNELRRLQR